MSEDYKEKKDKEPKRASVRAIETRGESSLVEWSERGILKRGYIQAGDMLDGKVLANDLACALPVGPDPSKMDVRKFTKMLRQRGIWTQADFQQKHKAVIRSLLEAMEVK